jgi:hypothetical protein
MFDIIMCTKSVFLKFRFVGAAQMQLLPPPHPTPASLDAPRIYCEANEA